MELAATQREKELEMKLKLLQLKGTNGFSGDSLSSVSSPLRAKNKTQK